MSRKFSILIACVLVSVFYASNVRSQEIWNCPDGEFARKAFISGEIKDWPNYTNGHGARVQYQFPDTALIPHAKFVATDRTFGAVCQYYNHVGLTATFLVVGAKKTEVSSPAYWRQEFRNSTPEEDEAGKELMDVCMVRVKNLAKPSIACPFILRDEDKLREKAK